MSGEHAGARIEEAAMLAEIILLRLEAELRARQEALIATHSRFVPICPGMVFKRIRTRH